MKGGKQRGKEGEARKVLILNWCGEEGGERSRRDDPWYLASENVLLLICACHRFWFFHTVISWLGCCPRSHCEAWCTRVPSPFTYLHFIAAISGCGWVREETTTTTTIKDIVGWIATQIGVIITPSYAKFLLGITNKKKEHFETCLSLNHITENKDHISSKFPAFPLKQYKTGSEICGLLVPKYHLAMFQLYLDSTPPPQLIFLSALQIIVSIYCPWGRILKHYSV